MTIDEYLDQTKRIIDAINYDSFYAVYLVEENSKPEELRKNYLDEWFTPEYMFKRVKQIFYLHRTPYEEKEDFLIKNYAYNSERGRAYDDPIIKVRYFFNFNKKGMEDNWKYYGLWIDSLLSYSYFDRTLEGAHFWLLFVDLYKKARDEKRR